MKNPTFLYKDGNSILIDASEVAEKMAEGWNDSPHAPEPAPEQPQQATDVSEPATEPVHNTDPVPVVQQVKPEAQQAQPAPEDPQQTADGQAQTNNPNAL